MASITTSRDFMGASLQAWRNGTIASGAGVRALASTLNHILGRRLAVVPPKVVRLSDVRSTNAESRLWSTVYRASPNGTVLVAELLLVPSTAGHPSTPSWYVKVDGVAQPEKLQPQRSHSDPVAADIFVARVKVAISAPGFRTIELWTKNYCKVVGWSLHELERSTLVTGVDAVVDPTPYRAFGRVFDANLRQLLDVSPLGLPARVFEEMRGVGLAHHVDDPAIPIVPTTTATNPWDGSTARTASTAGVPIATAYRNRYSDENTAVRDIPCYVWAIAERTSGSGTITVRFIGEDGSYDLAITGGYGLVSNTGTFKLRAGTSKDKIDVHILKDAAGTTGNVYGFGLIPLGI